MKDLSVGPSVCLSSALWKNGESDPDAVWHHRSDGSGMRQVAGFGDRSMGGGTFRGKFGAHHCPQGPIGSMCATAPRRGPLAKLLWADLLLLQLNKYVKTHRHCCRLVQLRMAIDRRLLKQSLQQSLQLSTAALQLTLTCWRSPNARLTHHLDNRPSHTMQKY